MHLLERHTTFGERSLEQLLHRLLGEEAKGEVLHDRAVQELAQGRFVSFGHEPQGGSFGSVRRRTASSRG